MQTDEPAFIKNKFAQLVVGVMCADYPHAWPHVWAQLLGLLPNGPVAIDLVLRVLNTVHEEVVSAARLGQRGRPSGTAGATAHRLGLLGRALQAPGCATHSVRATDSNVRRPGPNWEAAVPAGEAPGPSHSDSAAFPTPQAEGSGHDPPNPNPNPNPNQAEGSGHDPQLAARIKDAMRAGCLPQLVEAWQSILQLHESAGNDGLCAACLHTMHLYVSWIDIGLVTSPLIMQRLLGFVREPALHEGACLCLTEMVLKRMDVELKLPHLQHLDIVRVLAEAAAAELTLTPPLATLAASVALELLNCWDSLSQNPETAALASQAALPLLPLTLPLTRTLPLPLPLP